MDHDYKQAAEDAKDYFAESHLHLEALDGPYPSARQRGVERIPVAGGVLSEETIDRIIWWKAEELAKDGRRISLAPKRLADGLAVDWVYDRSVMNETITSIVEKIPRYDTKELIKPATQPYSDADIGRSLYRPIVLDDNDDETSCASGHKPSRNSSRINESWFGDSPYKRRHSDDNEDRYFILNNLSDTSTSDSLRQNMVNSGIPPAAISEITIRRSLGPSRTVAVINVAEGYAASELKAQLLQGRRVSTAPPAARAFPHRGTSQMSAPPSFGDHRYDRQHVVDLTAHGSDMDFSDSSGDPNNYPNVPVQTRAVQPGGVDMDASPSPALSYLTIEPEEDQKPGVFVRRDEPELNAEPEEAADGNPLGLTAGEQDSSDLESESDDDHEPVPVKASFPPRQSAEEVLAHRLLHGPIDDVNAFLQNTAAHNVIRVGGSGDPSSSRAAGLPSPIHTSSRHHARGRVSAPGRLEPQPRQRVQPASSSRGATTSTREQGRPSSASVSDLPEDEGFTVVVPKTASVKGRRLLVPGDKDLPMAAVYMHGDVQFLDQKSRQHISRYSLPIDAEEDTNPRHVVDALMLEDTVVIGYNKGRTQVTCVPLNKHLRPIRYDLTHRAHNVVHEHRRVGKTSQNRGISSMCVFDSSSHRFLSAGEDGRIHVWSLTRLADGAKSKDLGIDHAQRIQCVGYVAPKNQVLSCSLQTIRITDLGASNSGSMKPILLSSKPQQVHVHPQNPSIVIFEVDHRDRQIQIYDTRKSNFRAKPCIEFGVPLYETTEPTRRVYSPYKGSTLHSLFARGYQDGQVRVWDYRKPQAVLPRFQLKRRDPVEHAVLQDNGLIVYGGHTVTFWNLNATSR